MPASTISTSALTAANPAGRAYSLSEFNDAVIAAVNNHAATIDAFGPGGGSATYVDLGVSYGVVANSKAAAAANQAAIELALSDYAATFVRLKTPRGKIYVDKDPGSGTTHMNSICLDGATHTAPKILDFTDSIICQYGAGNGGQWSLLQFRNGFKGGIVLGGVLQCSMITNPDPSSFQHYLIEFTNSAGTTYTGDVSVIGTRFGQSKRAAIRFLGEAGHPVSHIRLIDISVDMAKSYDDTSVTPTGGCIEVQRGHSDILISGFYLKGAHLSTLDFEPTAAAGTVMDRVTIENGTIDGTGTTATQCVSLGGGGTGQESTRSVLRNVEVISGQVAILSSASWLLDRVTIKLDQADAGTQLFSGNPLIYVYQNAIDLELRDCQIERTNACAAGPLVYALADAGTSGYPTRIKINGGRYVQATTGTIISVESATGFTITGNPTFRFDGATPTAVNAVLIKAVAASIAQVAINGFSLFSPNGKMASAVYFATAASGGWSITDSLVTGIQAAGQVTTGVTFDLSAGAYAAGSRMPVYPVIQANDFGGCTDGWVAANSAAGTVNPVIAGSRGGVCTIEGKTASPATLPIVATSGSEYIYSDATTPTFWRKVGSTWTQVTVP
jgi:hypothetical protein